MTTLPFKLPTIRELRACFIALKADIGDEYRAGGADEDDTSPSMDVTIGASIDGTWNYQTGDNSYTGGAYGHPHWACLTLTRRSNSTELAREALDQLGELMQSEIENAEWAART